MATVKAKRTVADVKKVTANILRSFDRKEAAVFALAASFAIKILNEFRKNQAGERYWKNQTQQAFQRVFSGPFRDSEGLGFFIAHGVDYGVYLELANNRKHAALKPLADQFVGLFKSALMQLYG